VWLYLYLSPLPIKEIIMKKNNSYPQDLEIKGTYAGKNPFYAQVEGNLHLPGVKYSEFPGFI
jgi:hypothetical protein